MTTVLRTASTIREALHTLLWRTRRQKLHARELREIEQHCRALLDELEPTIRWDRVADVAALSSVIGTQRRRPIHLEGVRLPPDLSGTRVARHIKLAVSKPVSRRHDGGCGPLLLC
jgi:hypothetical protein